MRENTPHAVLAKLDVRARLAGTVVKRSGKEDGQRKESEDERRGGDFTNHERKSDESSERRGVRVYGRGLRGDFVLEHGRAVSRRVRAVVGEEG